MVRGSVCDMVVVREQGVSARTALRVDVRGMAANPELPELGPQRPPPIAHFLPLCVLRLTMIRLLCATSGWQECSEQA